MIWWHHNYFVFSDLLRQYLFNILSISLSLYLYLSIYQSKVCIYLYRFYLYGYMCASSCLTFGEIFCHNTDMDMVLCHWKKNISKDVMHWLIDWLKQQMPLNIMKEQRRTQTCREIICRNTDMNMVLCHWKKKH